MNSFRSVNGKHFHSRTSSNGRAKRYFSKQCRLVDKKIVRAFAAVDVVYLYYDSGLACNSVGNLNFHSLLPFLTVLVETNEKKNMYAVGIFPFFL